MHSTLVALLALAVTSLIVSIPAFAQELPKRKPGLWEIKSATAGQPGARIPPVQHCIDEKTDQLLQQSLAPKVKQDCSKQELRKDGNRVSIDSVCRFGNTTATTHALFTGDFNASYRGEISTSFEPPMMGQKEHRTTIEARWIGPCQAGQKPGDMVLPGGMRFNPAEMPRSK